WKHAYALDMDDTFVPTEHDSQLDPCAPIPAPPASVKRKLFVEEPAEADRQARPVATPLANLKKLLAESAATKRAAFQMREARASSAGGSTSPPVERASQSMLAKEPSPAKPEQRPLCRREAGSDDVAKSLDDLSASPLTRREQLKLVKEAEPKGAAKPKVKATAKATAKAKAKAKAKATAKGKAKAKAKSMAKDGAETSGATRLEEAEAEGGSNPSPAGKAKRAAETENGAEASEKPPGPGQGSQASLEKRPGTETRENPPAKKKRGPKPRSTAQTPIPSKIDNMDPAQVMIYLQGDDQIMRLAFEFIHEMSRP
ncbi:unnamed protein product, partial [Symbiodinium pilosum]